MALRNRIQYVEQPVSPVIKTPPQQKPTIQKRKLITKQEKMMFLTFVIVAAVLCVIVLHKQGEIQTATIDIQKIEANISEISNQNVDYKVQISEKSTFERIMAKAKERGLTLNENNVKVVPGE